MTIDIRDRFEACLLGVAVGDALGAKFEAQSGDWLRSRFPTIEKLIAYPTDEIWYTDDTQMTIGVCEALIERGEIVEESLCRKFSDNYMPSRGYGRGARAVLSAMELGHDYREVAESYFPGGSYGNGAAMRVAPIGLFFRDDETRLLEQARLSALPTHRHPLGIEGAQLLALAVGICSKMHDFHCDEFFGRLLAARTSDEYRVKLEAASTIRSSEDLATLGNGIEALESVVTAIASFALSPESYEATIGNVILLGGDTDTTAAMAGGLSGAYLGTQKLPRSLVDKLESSVKGREYLRELSAKLAEAYERNAGMGRTR
jgi:poly(ADP-ribose) glycohydrolase ARH3